MEFQVIDIFDITVCSVDEVYYRDLVKVKVDCCFEVEVGLRSAAHHFEVQTKLENVGQFVFEARHDVTMV